MIINIDLKQFETLLQYIEDQKIIYNNKHIKINIVGSDYYKPITVEVKR